MPARIDRSSFVGNKINRLTITGWKMKPVSNRNRSFFDCICECGKEVEAPFEDVISGRHKSCGCLHKETVTLHGYTGRKSITPTYRSWVAMKQRCTNPNATHSERYLGRGITLCERWMKFENFLADMGDRPSRWHSIDRVDNDAGYYKENCRWATKKEQAANRHDNPRWEHRERNHLGQFK